jgi:hypothetical protein
MTRTDVENFIKAYTNDIQNPPVVYCGYNYIRDAYRHGGWQLVVNMLESDNMVVMGSPDQARVLNRVYLWAKRKLKEQQKRKNT